MSGLSRYGKLEEKMSNFICPHCQKIIDDGSDGFTSDREIELEKDIERLSDRNAKLEKRLYIAVQALEQYAKRENWQDIEIGDEECFSARFEDNGYKTAEKALAKIKEIEG